MAVVLTLVQTKQIRINIRKQYQKHSRNNTKQIKCKYTLTKHPHITKQVKTNTVQDIPKLNSNNIKYPQNKVALMYEYVALLSP